MGVADNKTYKNQYHFTDDYKDTAKENPSINGPDKINTTIKENPYRSNVEIEGGELVLQPDLSALFKAQGKRHSQGGMDVLLRPESFVFSDFKDLSITEKEKEQFEFKMGGSTDPQKNTPAEVAKKNVNIKHYNSLINNITDPYKDELARKSSAMMLEKYIGTLGNIAYLQEKKKDFPDGLPKFSLGSAPVYDSDKKNEIDESKQYAKYGGEIKSTGGSTSLDPECPCGRDKNGNCIQNCPEADYLRVLQTARKVNSAPSNYQQLYQNPEATLYGKFDVSRKKYKGPLMSNEAWIKFLQNESPEHKRRRLQNSFQANEDYVQVNPIIEPKLPGITQRRTPNAMIPQPEVPSPTPGDVTGQTQAGKKVNWQFTPWQKISQAYNWGQYAGVRRYMPYRSRYNATYADPTLLNPEQTIGDVKGMVTQQVNALNTLNPIMRNAQASQAYGQALNQIPAIRTQYDNQNAQISNQFRQYNNQVRNNESLVNMQNDQVYYQQAIEGRKNFDNMRTYTSNQAMNNVMRDVETNQKLAYNLLTQNNPAYSFDWKTGDFIRNPKNIKDVSTDNTVDAYKGLFDAINEITDPIQKATLLEKAYRQKNILPYLNQPSALQKKGGKVKKNPYK